MDTRGLVGVAAVALALLAGCGGTAPAAGPGGEERIGHVEPLLVARATAGAPPVATRQPDYLLVSAHPVGPDLVGRVRNLAAVRATATVGLGRVGLRGRRITVAAVDPHEFRRWTPGMTARADEVWASVEDGDLAASHAVARRLDLPLGEVVRLGAERRVPLRVGAYATTVPGVDVVIDDARGRQLGVPSDNAVLVATGSTPTAEVEDSLRRLLPGQVSVRVLGAATGAASPPQLSAGPGDVAGLTGFRYRALADGSIAPDPDWVRDNIASEWVPILGTVTCHRILFPQLRAALQQVVDEGLRATIHADEYGGCYVPRFIGHDPRQGISMHAWGLAVDLNVPGNQRGTPGRIDPRVVAILERWGFAWGGDWRWTDPMHFQLATLTTDAGGP